MTNILGANPRDRAQFFIDAQNLHGSVRNLGRKMIWSNLMSFLQEETRLVRANYYTTFRASRSDDRFFGMLHHIERVGFTVKAKEIIEIDHDGRTSFRGTMVGEITASMVNAAHNGTDHIFLMSGDSELCAAIEMCKSLDCRVTVVSTEDIVSRDLVRMADAYVSLAKFPTEVLENAD